MLPRPHLITGIWWQQQDPALEGGGIFFLLQTPEMEQSCTKWGLCAPSCAWREGLGGELKCEYLVFNKHWWPACGVETALLLQTAPSQLEQSLCSGKSLLGGSEGIWRCWGGQEDVQEWELPGLSSSVSREGGRGAEGSWGHQGCLCWHKLWKKLSDRWSWWWGSPAKGEEQEAAESQGVVHGVKV